MIRFNYVAPSSTRYVVTVIPMNDGSFDCYAATKAENGREILLAIEERQYERARFIIGAGACAVVRHELTDAETFDAGEGLEKLGLVLADSPIWTKAQPGDAWRPARGMVTDYPQPLSFFLQ